MSNGLFYAGSTNSFYSSELHADIPEDAVQLTQAQYDEAQEKIASGMLMQPGPNGFPEFVVPPEANPQLGINSQAEKYLADTDWYVVRFMETGVPVPADVTQARQEARESIVKG